MKHRPYLYFLSNTKATTEHGALFGIHFLQFCNTCSKYSRIKLFAVGLPNHENRENFGSHTVYAYTYVIETTRSSFLECNEEMKMHACV